MTEPAEKGAGSPEKEPGKMKAEKKPFLHSSFYDVSDIRAAEKTAYAEDMDPEELKRQRRNDWLFLAVGIPALIGLIYLIVMLSR